jgi:hypothetical protein
MSCMVVVHPQNSLARLAPSHLLAIYTSISLPTTNYLTVQPRRNSLAFASSLNLRRTHRYTIRDCLIHIEVLPSVVPRR